MFLLAETPRVEHLNCTKKIFDKNFARNKHRKRFELAGKKLSGKANHET